MEWLGIGLAHEKAEHRDSERSSRVCVLAIWNWSRHSRVGVVLALLKFGGTRGSTDILDETVLTYGGRVYYKSARGVGTGIDHTLVTSESTHVPLTKLYTYTPTYIRNIYLRLRAFTGHTTGFNTDT